MQKTLLVNMQNKQQLKKKKNYFQWQQMNSILIIIQKNHLLTRIYLKEACNFIKLMDRLLTKDIIIIGLVIHVLYMLLVILIRFLTQQLAQEEFFMELILMVLVLFPSIPPKNILQQLKKVLLQIFIFMSIQALNCIEF